MTILYSTYLTDAMYSIISSNRIALLLLIAPEDYRHRRSTRHRVPTIVSWANCRFSELNLFSRLILLLILIYEYYLSTNRSIVRQYYCN